MPSYDYRCRDCGQAFTIRLSMAAYSEGVRRPCPACGSANVERTFSALHVVTRARSVGGASAAGCGSSSGFT